MPPTKAKAREMLRHGEVHGKPLTKPQRGLFGLIASGKKPTKIKKRRKMTLREAISGHGGKDY